MSSIVLGPQWWAKIEPNCIFGWTVPVKSNMWDLYVFLLKGMFGQCLANMPLSRWWTGLLEKIYTWTKVLKTKQRQYSEASRCSSIRERERICFWGQSTGRKMYSESKLGPLISLSWPLLKLKPQISLGCYGLHGPLITLVGASGGRERGEG